MLDGAVSNSHSWWWGSHVSPKHSRWLKENLADMDLKVKDMLKLIEEDADSFAKRAEMYYKKRPELLSLVEEFYRTYRALTERYDHITGELHQVQCSMGNAFPNQLQNEMDSFSPQASILNKQNQDHVGKELEGFGAVMEDRGHECVESKETAHASACLKETGEIDFNELTKLQKEISSLHQEKEKLKTECEKGVHEVRVVQEQLLQMQVELHHVQEENHKLTGNSSSYVAQISELRDQVSVLKRQNDAYVEEVEVVSQKLQFELQEKNKLIMEIQRLEVKLHDLERQTEVKSECSTPDQGSNRKKFANLQDDLFKLHHENHNLRMQVMTGVQQLQKANEEIQKLHHSLLKSQAENDTMILQYQQSLKLYESAEIRAKDLQIRMGFLQEENRRIRDEIAGAVLRMKITEGAHNLERENNAFQQNIWHRIQRTDFLQGLRAKQDEVQNLGMGILDETQQIVNFDAVIRNYQQSLSQSQEQQNKLSAELQDGNERLKDAEKRIKVLEEEIHNLHREKDNLKEESSSAVVSIKNLEQEVYKLKQEKNNLLNEVAFRLDQRDALQQELYCLKEDRNDLDRKYQTIMKQIESWGLDVASIRSVFASLQYIRQKLREHRQIHEDENVTLLQVLQKMEELLKRTVILENLATSHQLEADKLEFEMKHLKHHVEDLQKEKAELLDETKHQYGRIRNLEEKLEDANILYSQLQKDSQQHEYELADALDCMKHLNIQICSLQGEKEILQNETVESTLQMSYAQKQVDLLKEEVKDLKNKLDEEINKEQKSETEIKKLKQIMCEMDNRNQTLSDDYHTLDEKFGAVEEKVKELEETTLKQQIENDMLLHNLSSAIEFNRELEPDIQKLQKLLGVSCNAEGKLGNDGAEATKMLKSIVVQVKNLQKELTHFQEENQNLLNDALAKKTDLEQLQRNIFVLSAEKESIKEEAVFGLENIASLQKENSQLQAVIDSQRINLEAGLEREGTLILEIRSLQQSLKSSVSAHLALEGEYQRILEEHNSMKACLKESESKLLKTEEENQTLLIEALSQVSLVSLLESLIVEKDENMQIMEEQLNSFQENISKVECWLQSGGSTPQMREAEIWQLQEFTGGFREEEQGIVQGTLDVVHGLDKQLDLQIQKGANQVRGRGENVGELCLEGTTLEMTEKELQQEVPILTEEGLQLKYHVPVKYDIKIMHDLQEEKQREDDKISCRSIQKWELHAMPMETQAQGGKPRKPGEQQQDLIMKAERHYESPKSSLSEKTYFEDEHWKNDDGDTLLTVASAVYGSDARREVQDCKSQVPELQNLITDVQQENIELKCHRWKKNSVETIKGKEYPQDKEQNSKLRLEERHLDIHDDKDGLFDEERGGESIEENFRHDICCLQELNQKLWTRFDSATQQFSKLQINFQELQEKFWKTRLDNKKATADGQKGKQTNDTEKQLQELQDELLVWLECNDMLTKEAQNRFATAHRLQAELAAAKGGQSGDKCEETESASSQEEKLQNEVLSIEEESSKIADMLQAGSDQARALEFEVEKILLKFQGERKILSIEQHKKAHIPRVRTSLRTFLFGKEEQRQKRRGAWVCMHPVINE